MPTNRYEIYIHVQHTWQKYKTEAERRKSKKKRKKQFLRVQSQPIHRNTSKCATQVVKGIVRFFNLGLISVMGCLNLLIGSILVKIGVVLTLFRPLEIERISI